MDLTVRPYEGIGPVDFGATENELDCVLGPPSNRVIFESNTTTLYYHELGVKVELDSSGKANFVEVVDLSLSTPAIFGVRLMGSLKAVLGKLSPYEAIQGSFSLANGGSFYLDDLGIILWCENTDRLTIDTAGVYSHGYWGGINR